MMEFLRNNAANIIVGAVILGYVIFVVSKLIKDKKSGKSCSCGSSCGSCPSSSMCHHK